MLLTLTAVFALLLIWDTLPSGWLFFFAMVLRMSILGAYAALLVVTAEVFPTKIRATGVGMCGSVARVAGIITPFVAEISVNDSYVVPLAVYSGTALLAAVVAMLLPLETAGVGTHMDGGGEWGAGVGGGRGGGGGGGQAGAWSSQGRAWVTRDGRDGAGGLISNGGRQAHAAAHCGPACHQGGAGRAQVPIALRGTGLSVRACVCVVLYS